jgi:hypothetical protein
MRFDENPDRNCANGDTEAWFPPRADISGTRDARALCNGCPVIEECLRYAIHAEWGNAKSGRDGIYGATTPAERYALEVKIRGGKPRKTTQHGTDAGYKQHQRRAEKACDRCIEAHRDAGRERAAKRREDVA